MNSRASRSSASPALAARPLCPDLARPLPAVYLGAPTWHPLIFRKRVKRADPAAKPGDLVAVYCQPIEAAAPGEPLDDEPAAEPRSPANAPAGDEHVLLGHGYYNPRSEIAVRVVRHGPAPPDDAFWNERLANAAALRRHFLKLDEQTDAYRLVHAESDGFPGLVVDRLGDVLSAEVFSLGMYPRVAEILTRLAPLVGAKHWLAQISEQTLAHEGFEAGPLASPALPGAVVIHEHGSRFRVRFAGGHKTGFFCDQRDNRRALASFAAGKSVLDLCCYSGGFAIQAKKLGGADEVIGVDLDEAPLALARENAALNQARVKFVRADVFPYMRDAIQNGRQFDVVVLDPPKLIRARSEIEEGARKHFDLNRLAMRLVKPGGLFLTCSCSGLLTPEAFQRLLYAAARHAGAPLASLTAAPPDPGAVRRAPPRPAQILMKTGAAPDHPVAANCPETEYLQAFWMRLG